MKFEQGNEYLDELLTNPETARQVAAAQRRPMIPAQAVEAATYAPLAIPVVRHGCQDCSYNSKYGVISCKEHRGW